MPQALAGEARLGLCFSADLSVSLNLWTSMPWGGRERPTALLYRSGIWGPVAKVRHCCEPTTSLAQNPRWTCRRRKKPQKNSRRLTKWPMQPKMLSSERALGELLPREYCWPMLRATSSSSLLGVWMDWSASPLKELCRRLVNRKHSSTSRDVNIITLLLEITRIVWRAVAIF